ncbi:MAG: hypothetical protein JWM20_766 [Patescibacteria group bacterium]|nr:hypothetical protein [Patescibacteria group bacterium]
MLILKGILFGMGSSIPIGAAAAIILHEAYHHRFKLAAGLVSLPVAVDVVCMIIVFANLDTLEPFIANHVRHIQFIASGFLFIIAIDLLFFKGTSVDQEGEIHNAVGKMLKKVWINFGTTAAALILILPNLGGLHQFESVPARCWFILSFIVGAVGVWMSVLKGTQVSKDWIRSVISPERLRPVLGTLVLCGSVGLFCKALFRI